MHDAAPPASLERASRDMAWEAQLAAQRRALLPRLPTYLPTIPSLTKPSFISTSVLARSFIYLPSLARSTPKKTCRRIT